MKFEHLIEINDLNNIATPVISREQLWRGLVLRAESPQLFISYLDQATISERTELSMERVLRYGELMIRDSVRLQPLEYIDYTVSAQGEIAASSLRMSIDEPSPEALFVRFTYDSGQTDDADAANALYDEYRKSAYLEGDIETIRIIRQMAEAGRFDHLLS